MRSFGKYFWNRIKSTWAIPLVITVVCFFSVLFAIGINNDASELPDWERWVEDIIIVCCTVFPIISLWDINGKRSAETLFSLPVSKSKIATAHLLLSIIYTIIASSLSFSIIYAFVLSACKYTIAAPGYISVSLLCSIIVGICYCAINSFLFTLAENRLDGCIFVIAWQILPTSIIDAIINGYFAVDIPDRINDCLLHPQLLLKECYYKAINAAEAWTVEFIYAAVILLILMLVSVILAVCYFNMFNKKSIHKIGGTSGSVFGYPLLISISGLVIASESTYKGSYLLDELMLFWAIIFCILGCMLYRRSVKLKPRDLLTIGLVPILFFLFLTINVIFEQMGVFF